MTSDPWTVGERRKSNRVGETNSDGVTRLWFNRLFLRGKEGSRVSTMELENVAGYDVVRNRIIYYLGEVDVDG